MFSLFFTFGLKVESIKEFRGASNFLLVNMKGNINKEMEKENEEEGKF
jgi:hypothetical protein